MKKFFQIIILTFTFSQIAFAETCPSVKEIKERTLKSWQLFDSDDGKLLSAKQERQFIENVNAFVLAEWTDHKKSGAIHCYYRNSTGAVIEAYLAKNHFTPVLAQKSWYQVTGAMHCAAGKEQCKFETINETPKQLASKAQQLKF